jgi:hypothetical protein
MNTKRAKGEGDYAYLTMPEWIKHMYMLYERNVVENCIQELLKEELITRRAIKRHGQKTFEYTLNVDAIHNLIKALPPKADNETLPNLSNYLDYKERSKAEKKEAREKSRTSDADDPSEKSRTASEKSRTASEKSRTASEKSRPRYVKNQLNIDSITELPIDSQRGSVADEIEIPTSAPVVATTPSLSSFSGDKLSTQRAPASTPKRVCKEKPLPSKKTEPILSEKARVVWEVWLQMPWNKEMAPDLTETAAKHCEKLSTVEITVDIMFKIRNFANKNDNNGFYKGKAWTLGNVVKEYPNWKSAEYKIELQIPKKRKMTDAERNALPY